MSHKLYYHICGCSAIITNLCTFISYCPFHGYHWLVHLWFRHTKNIRPCTTANFIFLWVHRGYIFIKTRSISMLLPLFFERKSPCLSWWNGLGRHKWGLSVAILVCLPYILLRNCGIADYVHGDETWEFDRSAGSFAKKLVVRVIIDHCWSWSERNTGKVCW